MKKNLSEEYDEAINSPALQTVEVHRHETAGPFTLQNIIHHDSKVHEASLATVAGLGGDVIASRVLHMSSYLGHTESQSEKAKVGAVNLASTNLCITNAWKNATWLIDD